MVIAIAIGSIALGAKGVKNALRYSAGKQIQAATSKASSPEPVKFKTTALSGCGLRGNSLSDYQVVIENDLLRPLGWQRSADTPPREPVIQRERRQEQPRPPSALILTGITYLGGEPMALVEDVTKGEAYFLKEGDKLKNHVVEAITEDNVTLVNGGSKITAPLGATTYYDADGGLLATGQEKSQAAGSFASDLTGESDLPKGDTAELSVIERMRARRRKEMGQE